MAYFGISFRSIDPRQSVHEIAAGSVETVNIIDAYPRRSRCRWPARRVEFASSSGVVEAYVVHISLSGKMIHSKHINKLKQEFAAGTIPREALHLTGRTGTFRLKDLPENKQLPNYMLLIRSRNQTAVTVTVRY
jgi:hypothetical protein